MIDITSKTVNMVNSKNTKIPKSNKLSKLTKLPNKKLMRHAPPKNYAYNETKTVVHIKSSTPFISAVKRIEKNMKFFEKKFNKKGKPINSHAGVEFITIKGMGKTCLKVLNLSLHFKDQGLKVDVFTKTIGVLDEFKTAPDIKVGSSSKTTADGDKDAMEEYTDDDEDDDDILRKRNVSSVEARIYLPK